MDIKIKLLKEQFCNSNCTEFLFTRADMLSNGTHLEVRDQISMQLIFKCRLANIDCLERYGK